MNVIETTNADAGNEVPNMAMLNYTTRECLNTEEAKTCVFVVTRFGIVHVKATLLSGTALCGINGMLV